jgi:hypothetical protein
LGWPEPDFRPPNYFTKPGDVRHVARVLAPTMSSEESLDHLKGVLVAQRFDAGFVALSYVVSFVGAASTLELINRRTGFRGLYNQ